MQHLYHDIDISSRGKKMLAIDRKIFLITGVSSGLGRAFAVGALEAGHTVIGTVRRAEDAEAKGVGGPSTSL
jgi:NAD(P)-dependent dehydrogenase (short-subunit alcohol dehydrogenase family)